MNQKNSTQLLSRYLSEYIGTALLLAVVTGSGIMGETLGQGNAAIALLGNSIATGAGLYVLITLLAPISGAHFNPAVSLIAWRLGGLNGQSLVGYLIAQVLGAISGVWLTHIMFNLPILELSTKPRAGLGIWVSELVSTLILLIVIWLASKNSSEKAPMLVALTVTAGYWFTSSTFFANPAVTIARSLSDTFVGINPADVIGFISAQLLAVAIMLILVAAFLKETKA